MPKTALADMLLEQDSLYTAIDRPEILALPYMRELRDELEAMIKVTKTLAHEQASLEGRRQAVTQESADREEPEPRPDGAGEGSGPFPSGPPQRGTGPLPHPADPPPLPGPARRRRAPADDTPAVRP